MRWKFTQKHKKVLKICLIVCLAICWGALMRLHAERRAPENIAPTEGVWYCAELDSRMYFKTKYSLESITYCGKRVDDMVILDGGRFYLRDDGKFVFRAQIKSFHKENGVFFVIESDTGLEYTYVRVLDGNIPG